MDGAQIATLTALAVLLCLLLLGLVVLVAGRRRTRAELAAAHGELRRLREQVDALSREVAARPVVPPPDFVITDIGARHQDRPPTAGEAMSSGQFVSVALGESLVRIFSFGYGVRRALSAESRNRIAFEMRREVKRARKQRRRDLKEAKRTLRDHPAERAA